MRKTAGEYMAVEQPSGTWQILDAQQRFRTNASTEAEAIKFARERGVKLVFKRRTSAGKVAH